MNGRSGERVEGAAHASTFRRLLARVPVRHRLPLLTWIGVYPVLTLTALAAEPLFGNAPVAVRTFVMSAIMVPAMVYVVMPFMRQRYCEDR